MTSIAVVGGGIVGVTASLLAARRGFRVTLFEAEPRLWSRASAVNEGKIHLGPVFALGDGATVDLLQRGALTFADLLDEALGSRLPWDDLTSDTFDYLVMPGSLLGPSDLVARYRAMNACLATRRTRDYLGRPLPLVVDPTVRRDARTGLPAFRTHERSVEPTMLGRLLTERLLADPLITARTASRVVRVSPRPGRRTVDVSWRESGGDEAEDGFDGVINATWDQQQALLPETERRPYNFRLKCAVRLPRETGRESPTVTLVAGPFGDVVTHRDYVYASWYPVGRLTNEHAPVPSAWGYSLLRGLAGRSDLIDAQLRPLRDLGLLPGETGGPGGWPAPMLVGGMIVGHGAIDIHARASLLHHRSDFGAVRRGGMVLATNYKFSTAPLAAKLAVDEVAREVGP